MRVVVTRAAHQAEELAAPLRTLGAEVILLPMIGIAPPLDPEKLRLAALQAANYDWIIFSSVNAVQSFAAKLQQIPLSARIATVGRATAQAAEQLGFHVSLTPYDFIAEALVDALSTQNLQGKRVLIPSAAVTRDVIAPALRSLGAQVDMVEAYRNVIPPQAIEQAPAVFREPLPDWVTFASSSAVRNLVTLVDTAMLSRVKIASIGPATSVTLRELQLEPAAEAKDHSIRGLIDAVSSCG